MKWFGILTAAALITLGVVGDADAKPRVNVNAAGASELAGVPGIDARLAARIVAFRAANGPFKKLDDLLKVPGFNKLALLKALDHIEAGPAPKTRYTGSKASKVDLNRASFAELLLVPQMTPRMAKAIVDYRDKNGPFNSISELQRVPNLEKRKLVGVLNHVKVTKRAATAKRTPPPVRAERTPEPRKTPTRVAVRSTPRPTARRTPPTPRSTAAPPANGGSSDTAFLENGQVDLNRADYDDLMTLPRMTEDAAQAILNWRKANGPFRNPRDLLKVPLFGEAAFQRLKTEIAVVQ